MDSVRTRNLKDLRQKRLQYFDKLQASSQPKNSHLPRVTDQVKNSRSRTQLPERSILAWDSPESTSPSLGRKKQNLHADATTSSLQNSATSQSQIGQGLHHHHGGGTYRKDESYASPLRRSLNHAQAFSVRQDVVNREEFSYNYKDFHPVERDKFFTTKPIEDATWPRYRSGAENVLKREASVLSDGKLLNSKSSRQAHSQSSTQVGDAAFDADHVENILREMALVREMKIQVHNELKTNFENHENGTTPVAKYDNEHAKYGDNLSLSAAVYSHDNTNERYDANHNATRTQTIGKPQADSRQRNKLDFSTDQNLEKILKDTKGHDKLLNQERYVEIQEEQARKKKETEEEEGDEEFNLGALQEAAKQGDDILRKYIKSLSQRVHTKAAKEDSSNDSLEQNLQSKPAEQYTSNSDAYTRLDAGLTKTSKEHIRNVYCGEKSLPSDGKCHNNLEENDSLKRDGIQTSDDLSCKLQLNVTNVIKNISCGEEAYGDDNHKTLEQRTDGNHMTDKSDHETDSSVYVVDRGNHVTCYQPKIAQPSITSSKLQELGLLDDIFSHNSHSSIKSAVNYEELEDRQIQEPGMELEENPGVLQLQTHRPGLRPLSPLKNVKTNKFSERPEDFSYVHIPFRTDDVSDTISDIDTDTHGSNDSDNVSNKYQHPKPPEIAKKPPLSRTRGYRTTSSSNASSKPSNPKRAKTPERHVVGVREHHEKERDARKQMDSEQTSGEVDARELVSPRRGESPTDDNSPGRATVSVMNTSFQRGVSPEPRPLQSLSVPGLDLRYDDEDGIHGNEADGDLLDDLGDNCDLYDFGGQEDDNETVLMEKIANFRPSSAAEDATGGIGASGDASEAKWCPQVSFELPHQNAIDDLLGRSSDVGNRQRGAPEVRPSSAGPQRSTTSGMLQKGRPSSAKSKVSQYMKGNNLYKRRWATSSSLWGSRSISTAGDLQVTGQRSSVTDSASRSPTVGRKNRPGSAKNAVAGGGDAGSKGKGQRSRPWSASYGGGRQKEEDFLKVDSSKLQDGQVVRALDSQANRTIPPLTMQLIVESPRTSEGISIWQLLPDEILLHILTYLNRYDLVQCAQTCSFFNRIALDDSLWRTIHLEKRVLTDFGLTQIGGRHPTHLGLIQCTGNITENGLRNLFRSCAESLKELTVSGCSNGDLSGDSLLLHASRCYNLRCLDASWCSVTDNGLTAINDSVHGLNSLCLNGCREVSDQCLRAVIEKHGQHLNALEVFGCFNLSTISLKLIGNTCKQLRRLNIGQCYKLTDESIANLAPHIKGVRHLDLRGCKQIREGCIRKIVRHCKKLESLVLANCTYISDTALNEIATYLSNIRHIDLAGCKKVTNEGVKALATNCHQLTTLDISSTSIDHRSVMALASYCSKSLRGIKLNCCKEITEASIIKLLKHCKQLQTLHLYGVKRLHTLSVLKLQYPCLMYDEKSRVPARLRQSES